MEYLLLIAIDADRRPDPEALAADRPKWMAYTQELLEAGLHRGGNALEDVDTASTVRVRDGETLISDGPFAETKEFLAGYYLIDVPDLDAALAWAAKMPSIGYGSVEVRPIRDVGAPAA